MLFHGNSANKSVKLLYAESTSLFSKIIRQNLAPSTYNLLDLGSHKGEFLEDLVGELNEYTFHTIAVDVNELDLRDNIADTKINASLTDLSVKDKSIDITLARYSIAWNSLEKQKEIIKEIGRVTTKLAIIQHQGADTVNPKQLQDASKQLFAGKIASLEREEFYFSSAEEIEAWFKESGLTFERIQHRKINSLSAIYIEKYQLTGVDADQVKNILSNSDYLFQTAWVIKFS